jgi:hypothetical protein
MKAGRRTSRREKSSSGFGFSDKNKIDLGKKRPLNNRVTSGPIAIGRHPKPGLASPNTKQGLCREFRFCSFGLTSVLLNIQTAAQALLGKR